MAIADITIYGAGIFGLSTAWACAHAGARVRVIDPGGPGAGASGGIVGALAPHVPEQWNDKKAFQLDSLLAAEMFWAEVAAASGISPGYGRTGRLQPLADAAAVELAQARAASAQGLWQGRASWRVVDAPKGWSPASPTGLVIFDDLTARLHPRRACESLAAALATKGVEVLREGPQQGLMLWATGAQGLADLGADLGRPVGRGEKGQAVLLRHAAPDGAPQIFVDGLHVIAHEDGTVAIGSTSEREYSEPTATDAACDALLARARAALPQLAAAPEVLRWAGLRPRAASRAPLLGPWPGRPGHFVANGGFKIGFGMAPGVARLMAELMLHGQDRIPDAFRLQP